jgi:O-antigen/teichoic acid export membrane protein
MEKAKRVARNTGFLYAKMGITILISLYVTRLILSALGTEDFGIYSVVAGMIAMLLFLNTAMTSASLRFMAFAQGGQNYLKQKQIFNVSIILHFMIAAFVVILIEIVGFFLFQSVLQIPDNRVPAAKLIFHFMVLSTFFTIISVPYDAVINARENMLLVSILGIFEAFLKLGIAMYITYSQHDKLIAFGLLMAFLSVFMLLLRRIYCHKMYAEVDFNPKKYFNKPLFKEMANYAGWSLLGFSSSMLTSYGKGIVINAYFGPKVNAAEGIANQINGQLQAFSITMLKALNPLIAKSEGAGDRDMMLNASMMGSKLSFFLLIIFFIPALIEMPYFFNLWLVEVPEYAVVFCRLLLLITLIESPFLTLQTSIEAVGNIRQFQIVYSIFNLIPLPVAIILFSSGYPPYSIYFVFMIYAIGKAMILVYFAVRECNLNQIFFINQVLLKCLLVFTGITILSVIPHFVISNDILRFFTVVTVSTISFLLFVWFIGLNPIERNGLKEIYRSVKANSKFQFIRPWKNKP